MALYEKPGIFGNGKKHLYPIAIAPGSVALEAWRVVSCANYLVSALVIGGNLARGRKLDRCRGNDVPHRNRELENIADMAARRDKLSPSN